MDEKRDCPTGQETFQQEKGFGQKPLYKRAEKEFWRVKCLLTSGLEVDMMRNCPRRQSAAGTSIKWEWNFTGQYDVTENAMNLFG